MQISSHYDQWELVLCYQCVTNGIYFGVFLCNFTGV
jgi:hypothetical protein